jgi:GT2 family glycosyltransferase
LGYISECIDSIYKNPPQDEYEIILVDNASADGTAQHIRKNYPGIKLVANNKNRGFAAAVNQGTDVSTSEYILLINADCEVYEHSIDRLIEYLDKNPKVAVAGPRILNSDGTIQYSCRTFPSFKDAAIHTLLAHIYPNNPVTRKYKLMDVNRDQPFKVDWVSGSCMMIRAKALEDTGTFDENYFMYVEDIDLCYRIWQKDWEVHYMPHSEVLHHIAGSSRKKKTRDKKSRRAQIKASWRMQKSVFYFFWKNYRGTYRVLLIPFIFLALGFRFLAAAIKSLIKA